MIIIKLFYEIKVVNDFIESLLDMKDIKYFNCKKNIMENAI